MAEMKIVVHLTPSEEQRTLVGLPVLNEETGEVVGEIISDRPAPEVGEDYLEATVKIAVGKLAETFKMSKGEIPFSIGFQDSKKPQE